MSDDAAASAVPGPSVDEEVVKAGENAEAASAEDSSAAAAAERQPLAYLSRGIAGVVGAGAVGNQHPVVVLNTPGSPVAVTDHLRLCLPLLAHSVAAAAAGP